jgi:hypothetical protein
LTLKEKLKNWLSLFRKIIHIGPKYSTERKLSGLISVLNSYDNLCEAGKIKKHITETYLDELPAIIGKKDLQLLIVGFDYFRERVNFFRSNPKSKTGKFGEFYQVSLAHAIHASSNAPVNYFDQPAKATVNLLNGNDRRTSYYWDGAVAGFNNPVLAGLIEAITNNGPPLNDYCILSIGTGTGGRVVITDSKDSSNLQARAIYESNINNPLVLSHPSFKILPDIRKMATSILSDPPDAATFIAYSILDPSLNNTANLVRINPLMAPELDVLHNIYVLPTAYRFDNDGEKKFISLLDMDMDAVLDDQVELINELCDRFIVNDSSTCLPNQLIRGNVKDIYLGAPTYKQAKEKWLRCK